jgi:hypothetical protein
MRAWWSFAGQNDFCFIEDPDPGAIGADGRLPVPLAVSLSALLGRDVVQHRFEREEHVPVTVKNILRGL